MNIGKLALTKDPARKAAILWVDRIHEWPTKGLGYKGITIEPSQDDCDDLIEVLTDWLRRVWVDD